ncbi:thermonuclease family protein [Microvirga puerhi]|uniref:Thermonuclease family protein n=1 Tax=Microvirga puerhi TaxID=2876078 RepID=A0ABS7VTD3_9HYPH|nr:thermonuclease family protein [Microvirga puerhi]MBZ6078823.1 thermonuclease family protein [Microvirga puerhi]
MNKIRSQLRQGARAYGVALILTAGTMSAATAQSAPPAPPMKVRVVDGDTFEDPSTRTVYRLAGVDACETDQRAALDGQPWPCGAVATAWLVQATLGKAVTCIPAGADAHRRILARCATQDHGDLAAAMIRAGIAVAYRYRGRPTEQAYADLEEQARKDRKGLWQSEFEMPWEYRQRRQQRHFTGSDQPD